MKQKCDIGGQISNQIDHNIFIYFESAYIKFENTSTGIRTKNMKMCKIQRFNLFSLHFCNLFGDNTLHTTYGY